MDFRGMRFSRQRWRLRPSVGWAGLILLTTGLLPGASGGPAAFGEGQTHFLQGRYPQAVELAQAALKEPSAEEDWHLLLMRSLLAVGRYPNALTAATNALSAQRRSIRLRLAAREVFLANGDPARASAMLEEIDSLAGMRYRVYRSAPNLVALGQTALLLGADPRLVLEQLFDRAKQADPKRREVYLASGQLALDKNDFELAAKVFREGLQQAGNDPDLHLGLAEAYAPSDRRNMLRSIYDALTVNTNHTASYLLLADHLIDAEDYEGAEAALRQALGVNAWSPEAWAYQAVIEHLRAQPEPETKARQNGLRFWPTNPTVDHLIGVKLSQKYRFAEAAACQRQALRFDAEFLAARIQLAQDLLRLGQETEGWHLAQEVHQKDQYNIAAYNLVTLKDSLSRFQTLTNRDFILRMSPPEAALYGQRALGLLQQAKDTLSPKYGLELDQPVIVEIFPEQKDFGVRTFGMPDNPGFLGVCFGPVITANSPASQKTHPANWQAVLWHEFCHVVTLQLTRNKMPRWLSEGISVYEELQANPAWGQSMNPQYRQMILGDDLIPIRALSGAFLAPKSDLHLQFAYYQSALVVEFLVSQFGLAKLRAVLGDLAAGLEINQAITRQYGSPETLERDFAEFARGQARHLGPGLEWEQPDPEALAQADPDWLASRATNYHVLRYQASRLLREEKWEEARKPLERLVQLYPQQSGPENAYLLLAEVHQQLRQPEREREVLSQLAGHDADAVDAFLRLMVLGAEAEAWAEVERSAERFLAVNPLVAQPYRYLGLASEAQDKWAAAIRAYQALLRLDPADPADPHFRLARLLQADDPLAAKRHLLQALEEAPRFREAHRLLLRMHRGKSNPDEPGE